MVGQVLLLGTSLRPPSGYCAQVDAFRDMCRRVQDPIYTF